MKQLISSDEAKEATIQHTKPCADCPFARTALSGWLGGTTREDWLKLLHSEARIDCHAIAGPQCAGAAIYRANLSKVPRDPTLLKLHSDRARVFASPQEFLDHHEGTRVGQPPTPASTHRTSPTSTK